MADETELPPDVNRGPEILAVCGSLVGLALLSVLARIWVRATMVKHVGADDWTIIAAMVVMFAEMMVIIPEVKSGAGRHWQYIQPPENVTKGLHLNFVTQPLCLIALCLTKVSVGLFLLRLTPSVRFRYFVIGTIIFTVLSATGNFLTVFFQCRPLAFTWDTSVKGSCIPAANLKFAAFFNSSVAVLTDVVFALLPVPILWKVQMNWRVKFAVAGILSLGIFAAVAAIVKITFLGSYGKHGDFLWDSADLTIWTTAEINVAIIAASFPCLKPLFKSIFDTTSATARYGSSKYKGYMRNDNPSSRTGKSDTATAPRSQSEPEFEMYNRAKFTTDINTGTPSITGSEESILPQDKAQKHDVGITKTSTVFVSYDQKRASGNWAGQEEKE
ncbi:hypothetical protein C8A05DRAFT_42164 [Staphylotrichum tortipilum]|uniref:Rhodopsin domain-containing protein n=1 Tax=Staphylotrichum tortipilum TaxID=2831512 RepID=A0AAN6RWL3_9PEZI|nr:hypothetical protein C8A05DRAFT_42164 [Staphylotrichum longicolle]